jgi:hypothetical protein
MKVLAVDPGGTSKTTRGTRPQGVNGATGAVLFEPISKLEIRVLEWRETVERMEFLDWAAALRLYGGVEYCICEAYKPASFVKTWEPDVIYIIGSLELIFRPERFFNHTFAGAAKAWGTPDKLRPYRLGDNPVGKGGGGHALMALSHALHWTANHWNGKS